MKFSRSVEKPVWETRSDVLLMGGDRGVLGFSEVRNVPPREIVSALNRLKTDAVRPFPVLYDLTAID